MYNLRKKILFFSHNLLERKADPNITRPGDGCQQRRSPLHAAIYHGNAKMARLLLGAGEDPKLTPTILHLATEFGRVEIVSILLDAGLDVNSPFESDADIYVGTPIQIAASKND